MRYRAWALAQSAGLAGCLAAASVSAEPAEISPAHDDANNSSCALKRDGAACTEADPIFQEAMQQLNRERAQQAREPGDTPRTPDAQDDAPPL